MLTNPTVPYDLCVRFPISHPSRGLLRDCQIFANLRLTFISSSTTCSRGGEGCHGRSKRRGRTMQCRVKRRVVIMWLNMPPIWRSIAPPPSPSPQLTTGSSWKSQWGRSALPVLYLVLLQAHDIAGCVTPAPAPVLNSVQFCDLAAADNESRFKILLYLSTYIHVQCKGRKVSLFVS